MGKDNFIIRRVDKNTCAEILLKFHYLKDISKGFKSGFNYGVYFENVCVGVIIYTGLPVPELVTGMLGLPRNEQKGLFELSRLCLTPEIQAQEHNLASWFVSKSIKMLRNDTYVRLILSYADADYHAGIVYRACNFKYYGLTNAKKDFWVKQTDGSFVKHSRGKVKGVEGEWRLRSRKHRFVMSFDKKLRVLWDQL